MILGRVIAETIFPRARVPGGSMAAVFFIALCWAGLIFMLYIALILCRGARATSSRPLEPAIQSYRGFVVHRGWKVVPPEMTDMLPRTMIFRGPTNPLEPETERLKLRVIL
jgi:hypothetical protein